MVRVLRPGGHIFLIAPSRGPEHRYPQDCWRFYPDGYRALARFAQIELVEVSTDWGRALSRQCGLGDTVRVFRQPALTLGQRAIHRPPLAQAVYVGDYASESDMAGSVLGAQMTGLGHLEIRMSHYREITQRKPRPESDPEQETEEVGAKHVTSSPRALSPPPHNDPKANTSWQSGRSSCR